MYNRTIMKLVAIVLMVLSWAGPSIELEIPITIDETVPLGIPFGTVPFICNGDLINTTHGIKTPSMLDIIKTGDKINVALTKEYKREQFFIITNTTDCKRKAQKISIDVYCTADGNSVKIIVASFEVRDNSIPYYCDSNCIRLDNPYTLKIKENSLTMDNPPTMNICDADIEYSDQATQPLETTVPDDIIEKQTSGLVLKKQLDYEKENKYTVNITISTTAGTYHQTINIIVEDQDDLGISFLSNLHECNISENTYATSCCVKATDLDTGINTTINYKILAVPPTANGIFAINETSGLISLKKELDRERVSTYVILIKGYQVDSPFDKANSTTVIIHVEDVDDNAPKMLNTTLKVNLTENVPVGTFVCQVTAEDLSDQGENAKFEYKVLQPETWDIFSLNSGNGLVTTRKEIDREQLKNKIITLKVNAVSKVNTSLTSETCEIDANIIDENDNSPVFVNKSPKVTIDKTQNLTGCIYQMIATDKDDGLNGEVTFSMEQNFEVFSISDDTGCVKLTRSLNETFSFLYTLPIKAEDKALNFKRSSLALLQIHVQDVNIHTPQFINLPSSIQVSEAIPPDTIVLELQANDIDPNDTITFNILNHIDIFYINQSSIRTKGGLDREKTAAYSLELSASDSLHENKAVVTVTVTDVNDNGPIFVKNNNSFETIEGQKDSTTIGFVTQSENNGTFGDTVNGDDLVKLGRQLHKPMLTIIGMAIRNQQHPCEPWTQWSPCTSRTLGYFGSRTRTRRCNYDNSSGNAKGVVENDDELCEVYCPTDYNFTTHGYCIKFYTDKATNDDAATQCRNDGGYLINIETKQKHDDIKEMMQGSNEYPYVGGRRNDVSSPWIYEYGVQNGFLEFHPGQPNDGSTELCLGLNKVTTLLIDVSCTDKRAFFCEIININ